MKGSKLRDGTGLTRCSSGSAAVCARGASGPRPKSPNLAAQMPPRQTTTACRPNDQRPEFSRSHLQVRNAASTACRLYDKVVSGMPGRQEVARAFLCAQPPSVKHTPSGDPCGAMIAPRSLHEAFVLCQTVDRRRAHDNKRQKRAFRIHILVEAGISEQQRYMNTIQHAGSVLTTVPSLAAALF